MFKLVLVQKQAKRALSPVQSVNVLNELLQICLVNAFRFLNYKHHRRVLLTLVWGRHSARNLNSAQVDAKLFEHTKDSSPSQSSCKFEVLNVPE